LRTHYLHMNNKLILNLGALLFVNNLLAQDVPYIKLVDPTKKELKVTSGKQFLSGSTCKQCSLTVNGNNVKVYSTGAFAYQLNLIEGDTIINIVATNSQGKTAARDIAYNFTKPAPEKPLDSLGIERIQVFPPGDLVLTAGDKIFFKVKAYTGCKLTTINNTPLYEMPNGIAGNYQGEYTIKTTDSFTSMKIPFTIVGKNGKSITKQSSASVAVLNKFGSDVCITKGRLAHLLFGWGEDRLGGAKMNYIDSNIALKIIGKIDDKYKVQLTPHKTAFVPEDVVTLAPKGTLVMPSLTDRWQVYGDSLYDYVTVSLTQRLPYQSIQEVEPNKIIVDVCGATNNTNWITQLQSCKAIKNVSYEQVQDAVYRIHIWLKQAHWGHSVYYTGNNLVVKIKQQPKSLALQNLTIAVDAGHGGSNTGAGGPTGSSEKDLTLQVSLKLQQALQNEGAKVLMTRTTEKFVDNKERILMYRNNRPDILLSIHLNSSGDPINAGGNSTHYRYPGFKTLNEYIHKNILELGLKDYGNIASFNFMLNSSTEYPNVLIETLFISNPAEEEMILDQAFQQKLVDKITLGLKQYLQAVKN
jgi:N-acetylmuramoyl-L-alanine amidase